MKQHIWCLTIWLKDYLDYDKYPFSLPKKDEFGWTMPITDWAIDQPSLHKKGIIHLTAGLERTQSGKWHLQSVVCYKTPKTFKHVQKQFPGAHIEFAKGTLSQNICPSTVWVVRQMQVSWNRNEGVRDHFRSIENRVVPDGVLGQGRR